MARTAIASHDGLALLHQSSRDWIKNEASKIKAQAARRTPRNDVGAVISGKGVEIPSPTVFRDLAATSRKNSTSGLPTTAQCAAHLELLQVFTTLHASVVSSAKLDAILDIKPNPRTVYERVNRRRKKKLLRDETFDERREAKWEFYLTVAATRFLAWLEAIHGHFEKNGASTELPGLPPIDVLVTWHSLLLNPQWYRNFDISGAETYSVQSKALEYLKQEPFPWHKIHQAIQRDGASWFYKPSFQDGKWFSDNTGMPESFIDFLTDIQKSTEVSIIRRIYDSSCADQSSDLTKSTNPMPAKPAEAWDIKKAEWQDFFSASISGAVVKSLVAAVQRQFSFASKMDNQLWLLSPAVEGTLGRAIDRYEKFLKLFKIYPKTMLVPTLDIDLVWHTHQCSPAMYDETCLRMAGRRINHDDKIESSKLDNGMAKTATLFRIRFLEEYRVCHCWDCEALLSAINDGTKVPNCNAIAFDVYDKVSYHRQVELARRTGQSPPALKGA